MNRQRKAKVVLVAMLDLAVRHDAIPTNPARGTTRVHRPRQETKALRVEDLIEIRAAVRRWVNADRSGPKATGDMADIIDLMLATGCRIGEILALRWSDLDLEGDQVLAFDGLERTKCGRAGHRVAGVRAAHAAYVFAGDLGRALRLGEALEAGVVGINRGLVSDPSAPFGGVKQSGLGREARATDSVSSRRPAT